VISHGKKLAFEPVIAPCMNYFTAQFQGLKLTSFGWCQLATEIFFQSPYGKMWSQKVSIKFFLCSETQTKILGRHGLAYVISRKQSANQQKQLDNDAFHVKTSQSAKTWLNQSLAQNVTYALLARNPS